MGIKKMIRAAAAVMLSAVMACTLAVGASAASAGTYYSQAADKGTKSTNVTTNGYTGVSDGWSWSDSYHAFTVNSNLFEYNGYLYRLEYTGKKLLLEKYSSSFKYVGRAEIKMELPIFGGFFAGEKYNFIVFGQQNLKDSDQTEVVRVVKYTKGMKKISGKSFYGCNTYIPFDAGSLRMDEENGVLYIHTCHEMYKTSDGLHHQSNMDFFLRESDMSTLFSRYDIFNISTGYMSHSFNQFIKVRNGNIFTVDHGDAYERAITACLRSSYKSSYVNYENIFNIKGSIGQNYTGVVVGGMELSDKKILVSAASVPQDNTFGSSDQKNVMLISCPYVQGCGETKTTWLTSYKNGAGVDISEPKLTKINDNSFMLMWTETKSKTTKLYVTMIDGNGDKKGKTHVFKDAYLSDCQPIVYNGQVVWYVTKNSKPTFYFLNADGDFAAQKAAYKKK
ncbi:MAG: hypothetical protein SOU50_03045 [Oscillospiraceae bacterium]|nr:hypothetical protein [Oscillospiraceae bacterium]MDY2847174.1 hypothetical protein [Oscillospiraceae bacterium]